MLYHGSKTPGIKTLKPYPHNVMDGESVVFGTPDIRFALAMIHGTGNQLAVGYINDEMYIDEIIPNAFDLMSEPGTVYGIADSGFHADKRLCKAELVSTSDTTVISEKLIPNVLNELRKYDIRFVNYSDVPKEMQRRGMDSDRPAVEYKPDRFV